VTQLLSLKIRARVGDVFGRLTVISVSAERRPRYIGGASYPILKCLCACGRATDVLSCSIGRRVQSCGCLKQEMLARGRAALGKLKLPKGVAAKNSLFSYYRANAARRHQEFTISRAAFDKMTSQACAYCGRPPGTVHRKNGSEHVYNGLDRVENSIGYIPSNTVPCCGTCNKLKGQFGLEQFISAARAVCAHNSKTKLCSARKLVKRTFNLVFTNGCFDVLHAGHITSLRFARAQGDALVVAVNSDSSVRRLKGETRPVNTLKDRMELLAALDCVDYVISFSEDTPLRLVRVLKPEILVKGMDYSGREIAGSAYAGKVVLAPLVPGRSTTETLRLLA